MMDSDPARLFPPEHTGIGRSDRAWSSDTAFVDRDDSTILRRSIRAQGANSNYDAIIADYQENETLLRDRIRALEEQIENMDMLGASSGLSKPMTPAASEAPWGSMGRTKTSEKHKKERALLHMACEENEDKVQALQKELEDLKDELEIAEIDKQEAEHKCDAKVREMEAKMEKSEAAAIRFAQELKNEKIMLAEEQRKVAECQKQIEEKAMELVQVRNMLAVRTRYSTEDIPAGSRPDLLMHRKSCKPPMGLGASLFDELDMDDDEDEEPDDRDDLVAELEDLRAELEETQKKLADVMEENLDATKRGSAISRPSKVEITEAVAAAVVASEKEKATLRESQASEHKAAQTIQARFRGTRSRAKMPSVRKQAELAKLRDKINEADRSLEEVAVATSVARKRLIQKDVSQEEVAKFSEKFKETFNRLQTLRGVVASAQQTVALAAKSGTEADKAAAERLGPVLQETAQRIEHAQGVTKTGQEVVLEVSAAYKSADEAQLKEMTEKLAKVEEELQAARGNVVKVRRETAKYVPQRSVRDEDQELIANLKHKISLLEHQSQQPVAAPGPALAESKEIAAKQAEVEQLRSELAERDQTIRDVQGEAAEARRQIEASEGAVVSRRSSTPFKEEIANLRLQLEKVEKENESRAPPMHGETKDAPTPSSEAGDTGGPSDRVACLQKELSKAQEELSEVQAAYLELLERHQEEEGQVSFWDRWQAHFGRMICCRDTRSVARGRLPHPPIEEGLPDEELEPSQPHNKKVELAVEGLPSSP